MKIRQPIITVVGHIDHGKTTILDFIRGTAIARKEAGRITQHVGATEIPIDAIKEVMGPLLEKIKVKLTIPGFLMIDTPGHEAFTNLRKRGGSIADIAILVIDINEGFKAQTREAVEILKQFKVPFVIAANKIDLIPGWKVQKTTSFLESFQKQNEIVKEKLDEGIYKLVIQLADYGFNSERFDRVDDYTKKIAIIPVSGITGEGISELLMVLAGLAQKYLEESLKIEVSGPARGSILEVKEEKGLGKTIDVIIYDGTLDVGDTIVVPGIKEPIITKVRALLKPSPLRELREKGKFECVKSVTAAAGIKVCAPGLDEAIAGMQVWEANTQEEIKKAKEILQKEVKETLREREDYGVIIKADTIGAIEALIGLFEKIHIPIKKANIGDLTKSDVMEASRMREKDPLLSAVLCFNVKTPKEILEFAKDQNVQIFSADVIYTLFENYQKWRLEQTEEKKKQALEKLIWPAKIRLLKGYVFRQSNPAIVGVEVLAGKLKTNTRLIRLDGKEIGTVKGMQSEGKNISMATEGQQVAVSIDGPTVGRQIKEGDELLVFVPRSHLEIIESEFANELTENELKTIREFKNITR